MLSEGPGTPLALEPGWQRNFVRRWHRPGTPGIAQVTVEEFASASQASAFHQRMLTTDCELVTQTFVLPDIGVVGTVVETPAGGARSVASFVAGTRSYSVSLESIADPSNALIGEVVRRQFAVAG